ncbi:hypothetical protein NOVOSPHI9U_590013 [Novosphingobium sp. 9U]|nr:hypothetical protein NOVOSPHI9U_590013 [Novosphingobium sp. 9U]
MARTLDRCRDEDTHALEQELEGKPLPLATGLPPSDSGESQGAMART